MPNFVGTFDEVVSCLGDLGSGSCGTFQPLEVVRRALDPSDALAGFSRPSADLVVIVIGATDDASTHDGGPALVTDFVAFLKGLKGGRGPELVFVVGPPAGCAGGAAPASAPRLHELADAFGWRGVYSALCAEHPLASLSLGSESVDPACLAPVVDTDLETPGLQADCVVEDETWDATGPHRMTLPACEHAAAPCWRLTSSPQTCPTGELLEVDRGPGYCGQDGFDIQVTCLGCAKPGDPGCVRAR